jgi:hypothetical protein
MDTSINNHILPKLGINLTVNDVEGPLLGPDQTPLEVCCIHHASQICEAIEEYSPTLMAFMANFTTRNGEQVLEVHISNSEANISLVTLLKTIRNTNQSDTKLCSSFNKNLETQGEC